MGEGFEFFGFVKWERPRAHEAHFATEDVPELGELVNAGFAEEFADLGNAGVVGDFEDGAGHFVAVLEFAASVLGIGIHGAEFPHGEGPSVKASSLLFEKDGAGRGEFDEDSGDDEQWRKDNQEEKGSDAVYDIFEDKGPGDFGRSSKDQHGLAVERFIGGACNRSFDEVGAEPGLNPLELAGLDGLLDTGDLELGHGEDDAAD